MEQAQFYNRALFLFALLMLACVAVYDFLPERRWHWLPQENIEAYVYSDQVFGGNSEVTWLNESELEFACDLKPPTPTTQTFCGIRIHLTDPWVPGADLSAYEDVEVEVDYQGGNKKLRLYMMEFVEGYSDPDNPFDDGKAKYLAAYVPADETRESFVIRMSEFLVADWWVNDEDVPRRLSNASRSSIMTFGVDIAYPVALGEHRLAINKVTFVGPLVSAENWYLGIVLIWIAITFIGTIARYYYLRTYTTHLQEEKNRYQQLSRVDALTGLLNRHGLMHFYDQLLLDKEERLPISMVLLDIDFFKRVNDNFGHSAGDVILQRIAATLQEHKPESAEVARWGGEEFLMILPKTTEAEACELAESLRVQVMGLSNPEINNQPITISIGVGELHVWERFEQSFKSVDDALYRAKSAGRNCFVCEPRSQK